MAKTKKQLFLSSAIVLVVASMVCKIIGGIFKIPLNNILKAEGVGLYQLVFPLYSLLLVVSSSGVPISISKMISNAKSEYESKLILKTSLKYMIFISIICAILIMLFSSVVANIQGNAGLTICYLILSPSVVFVSLVSVFRGYFQGKNNFNPTAISQILEQIVKVIFSISLAFMLSSFGVIYSVIGAIIGISSSEIVAFIFLFFRYKTDRKEGKVNYEKNIEINEIKIKKELRSSTYFITISALIIPLLSLLDSILYVNFAIIPDSYNLLSTEFFGVESGIVGSIFNLPIILSVSLSSVIVPTLKSKEFSTKSQNISEKCKLNFKLLFLLIIPCCVIFSLFAKEILTFLFSNALNNKELLSYAVRIMTIFSIEMIFISFMQISIAILQAKGEQKTPIKFLLFSAVVKIILTILLLRIPQLSIYSIAISSFVFYFICFIFLFSKVKNMLKIKFNFFKELYIPVICSFFCAYVSKTIYNLNQNILWLIISFVIFAALYLFLCSLFQYFSGEEIDKLKIKGIKNSTVVNNENKEIIYE